MERHWTLNLSFAVLVATATPHVQSEHPRDDTTSNWREMAEDRLEPAAIAQLDRDGLLIVDEPWRQVFSPYLSSDLPVFITSDSLLNAFHVLFSESIMQLEQASARRLPPILEMIWSHLPAVEAAAQGDPATVADASRRARVVIGTALRLLGGELSDADPAIAALVAEEVERVTEARALMKPAWLGPPDEDFAAIDYSRFSPRGFYAHSERLSSYFRAVAWLQAVPFRAGHDSELLAALMLGNTISYQRVQSFGERERIETQLRLFHALLGAADDWDLLAMARYGRNEARLNTNKLDELRTAMREDTTGDSLINDGVRFPPSNGDSAPERTFRVLAAHRTPDAFLFQQTTYPGMPGRHNPSGLEIAALLGSAFARIHIEYADRERLLAEIDQARGLLGEDSLYIQYLRCLAALFDAPDPATPAFLSGEAWAAKSCQTALAGWAQLRHTWALQAKQSVSYLGITSTRPGFVEPIPEFFARMGELVRNTEMLLQEAGVFEWHTIPVDALVREIADEIERYITDLPPDDPGCEMDLLATPGLETIAFSFWNDMEIPFVEMGGDVRKLAAWAVPALRQLADDLATGEQPIPSGVHKSISNGGVPSERLWRRLSDLCMQLEIIAHKQLRGAPLSERDKEILRGYGEQIAGIMLYGGNSYISPRNDAPRAIDVHWNPGTSQGLIVGIGRPRTLYVLYPTDEGPVLCRGAVLPYYEFTSERRLNDVEWRALLESDERPTIPTWMRAIVHEGELGRSENRSYDVE